MRQTIPAVFARGGTSNGLIFHKRDLPADPAERDDLLLRAMGSPDPYGRQLNGMGGGISSLSKVLIVGPPTVSDADVDFAFGQVAVDRDVIDWQGTCGNMSACVGPFAIDEGLVRRSDGRAHVRIHNVNTAKIVVAHFTIRDGRTVEDGDGAIPGVAGTGAAIELHYLDPGGAITSAFLPTGRVVDTLRLGDGSTIAASLVDATNPVVFVRSREIDPGIKLPIEDQDTLSALETVPGVMARLDAIRRAGAVAMGLAARPEDAGLANPKIALVEAMPPSARYADIACVIVSMERMHRALTLTGAMCLACAVAVDGAIPQGAAAARGDGRLRIATPSGVIEVRANVGFKDGEWHARSAISIRTQSRLMTGRVHV